jgi:hypothetical protein
LIKHIESVSRALNFMPDAALGSGRCSGVELMPQAVVFQRFAPATAGMAPFAPAGFSAMSAIPAKGLREAP